MSPRKPYFHPVPGAPAPLSHTVEREVRFEELDPLAIVWHGRYASYFEDARTALGTRYGVGYGDFLREQILAPVRVLHVDYLSPLQFGNLCRIEARLHWAEACRFDMDFEITGPRGELATTGYSVQVFLDRQENLLLVPPPFLRRFRESWREGTLREVTPPPSPPAPSPSGLPPPAGGGARSRS